VFDLTNKRHNPVGQMVVLNHIGPELGQIMHHIHNLHLRLRYDLADDLHQRDGGVSDTHWQGGTVNIGAFTTHSAV